MFLKRVKKGWRQKRERQKTPPPPSTIGSWGRNRPFLLEALLFFHRIPWKKGSVQELWFGTKPPFVKTTTFLTYPQTQASPAFLKKGTQKRDIQTQPVVGDISMLAKLCLYDKNDELQAR